jgi:uncharacterized membrane protein YbhN (UPF0104 family)
MPRTLRIAGRVAIAAAIFAYLFARAPVEEVLRSVAGADAGRVLAAVIAVFAQQLVVADRLRRLAQAYEVGLSTRALLKINLATLFYGLWLPGGNVTGFVARLYMMSASSRQYADVAVALACDRLVATVTLCAVGIGFWAIAWPVDAWPVLALMSTAAVGVSVLLTILLLAPGRLPASLWPARLAPLRDALHRPRSLRGSLVAALGLGLLTQMLGTAVYVLVASALDLDLSLATVGWTRAAAMLVAILPVSIAGLGVREGVLVLLLAPYGISAADALAYGLLAFVVSVLVPGLAGAIVEADRLLVRPAREI